jgi:hypothetical protein
MEFVTTQPEVVIIVALLPFVVSYTLCTQFTRVGLAFAVGLVK